MPQGSLTSLINSRRTPTPSPSPQPVRAKWERLSSPPSLSPPALSHAVSQELRGRSGGDVKVATVTSKSLPACYGHGKPRKTSQFALGVCVCVFVCVFFVGLLNLGVCLFCYREFIVVFVFLLGFGVCLCVCWCLLS